jgi:hypothetical protein
MNFTIQAEAPARKEKTVEEVTTLGKKVAEGEEYFAVAHIFASFNDTFVVSYFFVQRCFSFICADIFIN